MQPHKVNKVNKFILWGRPTDLIDCGEFLGNRFKGFDFDVDLRTVLSHPGADALNSKEDAAPPGESPSLPPPPGEERYGLYKHSRFAVFIRYFAVTNDVA